MVYILSDLEVPIRGRTYREPDGPHVAIGRGRDLGAALDHLDARPDCRALALIGIPEVPPDLGLLATRRLLLCGGDRAALREFSTAALRAGAEVEWIHSDRPEVERVAAWALPVGGVVLAAGASTRMGRNKLLLEAGGLPLVCHVVEAAGEGGVHTVYVVYSDEEVRRAIGGRATCVFNPEAAAGQSTSLQAGLLAQPEEMAAVLILLGDQPLVGARTVAGVLRAWRAEESRPAVAAGYGGGRWQPPVVIDRSLWPDLMTLSGDAGARSLFERRPELLDTVHAAGRPDDVDTPEDYARIVRIFPRSTQG